MEAKNPLGGNFLFVIKCLFIEDFHPHTVASDCVWDDRAGDGKDMGANPGCLRMKMSLGTSAKKKTGKCGNFEKTEGEVYPNPTSISLLFLTWETSQK